MNLPKIFVFGLDRAGKTFLTNSLVAKTIEEEYKPTLGFNLQSLNISDFGVRIWDAPGQKMFRSLWNRGYKDADLLMYVVDVSDSARFEDSRHEFDTVIKNMNNPRIPILFCYHKMDIPNAQANLLIAKKEFTASLLNRTYVIVETSIHDSNSLSRIKSEFINLLKKTRYAATALEKTTKKIVKDSRKTIIQSSLIGDTVEMIPANEDVELQLPPPPKPSAKLPTSPPSSKLPSAPPSKLPISSIQSPAKGPTQLPNQLEKPHEPKIVSESLLRNSSDSVFEFVRNFGLSFKQKFGIEMTDLHTILSTYEQFQKAGGNGE